MGASVGRIVGSNVGKIVGSTDGKKGKIVGSKVGKGSDVGEIVILGGNDGDTGDGDDNSDAVGSTAGD